MAISYVMITNYSKPDIVNAAINSVINELAPEDDFVVCGVVDNITPHERVQLVDAKSQALTGLTSHMRNKGYQYSKKNDLIVFLDDDVVLPPGYRERTLAYSAANLETHAWTGKIISSRGFALNQLPFYRAFRFMVSLHICVRQHIFEGIQFDENHGYYFGTAENPYPEDVKFSVDLTGAGFKYAVDVDNYIYLYDDEWYIYKTPDARFAMNKERTRPIRHWDTLVKAKNWKTVHEPEFRTIVGLPIEEPAAV